MAYSQNYFTAVLNPASSNSRFPHYTLTWGPCKPDALVLLRTIAEEVDVEGRALGCDIKWSGWGTTPASFQLSIKVRSIIHCEIVILTIG